MQTRGRVIKSCSRVALGCRAKTVLVYFGKIHAVSVLQAGDLPRVKLDFQISRENRNVNGLALRGVGAFGANAVKFHIPVVGLHEFVNDRIHNSSIVLGQDSIANRAKTLEKPLVCFS